MHKVVTMGQPMSFITHNKEDIHFIDRKTEVYKLRNLYKITQTVSGRMNLGGQLRIHVANYITISTTTKNLSPDRCNICS